MKTLLGKDSGFYAVRKRENRQKGFPVQTARDDLASIIKLSDYTGLKKEFHLCQHFLVDSELAPASYKKFRYAV